MLDKLIDFFDSKSDEWNRGYITIVLAIGGTLMLLIGSGVIPV